MAPETVDPAITAFVLEIRERLDRAAAIGRAAEACVTAGNSKQAVMIALDIEQLLYEANTLLNAASLIGRLREA